MYLRAQVDLPVTPSITLPPCAYWHTSHQASVQVSWQDLSLPSTCLLSLSQTGTLKRFTWQKISIPHIAAHRQHTAPFTTWWIQCLENTSDSLIMKPKEVSAPGIGRHFILHVCFKPALQMGLLNNQVVILSSTVRFDHHATDLAHTWHSATRGDIRQQDSLLPPCHMESRYNDSLKLELQLFHPRGNMLVSLGNCP